MGFKDFLFSGRAVRKSGQRKGEKMFGILTLKDDLTLQNLAEFVANLKDSITQWDVVLIDLEEVEKVDLAAVQLLIAAKKECAKCGRELIIRKTDTVAKFLRSAGIQL
jgi:anti-anti-sigma regulatory factor